MSLFEFLEVFHEHTQILVLDENQQEIYRGTAGNITQNILNNRKVLPCSASTGNGTINITAKIVCCED